MSTSSAEHEDRPNESERLLIDRAERGTVGVERFDDRAELIALIEQTTAGVKRELCSTLPAGPYPLRMLMNSWESDTAMISRGISMPVIYQSDAARKPEVLHYLAEFVAAGAKVRGAYLQAATAPVQLIITATYLGSIIGKGTVLTIASFVPVASTVTMPARIFAGTAAWREVAISLALAIGLAVLAVQVAARAYRFSVLRTGGRTSLLASLRGRDEQPALAGAKTGGSHA